MPCEKPAGQSVEQRIEEFILAPSDSAWGDERNRDEYYRAATIGQFWGAYASLLVAIVAALEGATVAAVAALIVPALTTIPMIRYCRRRGVGYAQVMAAFNSGRRRLIALALVLPPAIVWLGAMAVGADHVATDASTVLGGVVGAAVGVGAVCAALAWAKKREQRQDARGAGEDDVFE